MCATHKRPTQHNSRAHHPAKKHHYPMALSRSRYQDILLNICNPESHLEPLVEAFMSSYKSDDSLETYSANENIHLSDFYFDCESFEPEGAWEELGNYRSMCTRSGTLRRRAAETIKAYVHTSAVRFLSLRLGFTHSLHFRRCWGLIISRTPG